MSNILSRCILCNNLIGTSEHYEDWSGKCSCVKHIDNKDVYYCNSCGKLTPKAYGKIYSSSYFYCNDCIKNGVKTSDLGRIVPSVINLLHHVGFEDISIDNFSCRIESYDYFIRNEMENSVGYHTTLSCIRDEHGVRDLVEEITIRENLIELEFRAIIAHEILHSWQARNNLNEFYEYSSKLHNKKAMEGFAQMGTYLVYTDVLRNKPNSRMVKWKMKQLLENEDEIYGKPFLQILNQFNNYNGSYRQKWYYIIRCAREGKLNIA